MKRLQNRIAKSGLLFPVMGCYAIVIWLLSGLLTEGLWPQLVCYAASVYLLAELSNGNALLRIRSRIISSSFIALSCMNSALFSSFSGCLTQLFFIAAFLLLFSTYQNSMAMGRVFYAFAFLGGASVMYVQTLWLVPFIWLLMITQLLIFNWRTWLASVIGILAPYWFLSLWLIYNQDFSPIAEHLSGLWSVGIPFDVSGLPVSHLITFVITLALMLTGIGHFWLRSYEDKIRIRLLYGFFSYLGLITMLTIIVLPQYYDLFIRLAFICVSPLVGHFVAHTNSRATNIAFIVIIVLIFLITILNLWMPSLSF